MTTGLPPPPLDLPKAVLAEAIRLGIITFDADGAPQVSSYTALAVLNQNMQRAVGLTPSTVEPNISTR